MKVLITSTMPSGMVLSELSAGFGVLLHAGLAASGAAPLALLVVRAALLDHLYLALLAVHSSVPTAEAQRTAEERREE